MRGPARHGLGGGVELVDFPRGETPPERAEVLVDLPLGLNPHEGDGALAPDPVHGDLSRGLPAPRRNRVDALQERGQAGQNLPEEGAPGPGGEKSRIRLVARERGRGGGGGTSAPKNHTHTQTHERKKQKTGKRLECSPG